ncbi:MFS transporter [Mycoplasma sp. 4404]|uniref:MFS transporter n=1 Tax=Mycoplasma sp. 4404 TaxID=3108530 RepID=UPI002B1DBE54|nr:MFS transporter [Mycoplasma sp. 4404]MEA4162349.1 MFS transporter [Mycoplasma sp. 4404]
MSLFRSLNANLWKYISSISLSSIGSEAFKLTSSLYIYKITGDFWLVTLLYLLVQLPSLIIYAISSKLVKLLPDRVALLICDIASSILLIIPLGTYFAFINNLSTHTFSIILIVTSTLLGTVHSYRFIHIKNILYFLAKDKNELNKFNIGNSFAISIGLVLSPILSLLLYKYLPFYSLVIFNMLTYILSGLLYWSLKTKSEMTIFVDKAKANDKSYKILSSKFKLFSWIFILSSSLVIGIFLFPKQSGVIQFFKWVGDYKYEDWSFYFSMVLALLSLTGVIVVFLLNKYKVKIDLRWIIFGMFALSIIWISLSFVSNKQFILISYFSINALQQLVFSMFLPGFYSKSYQLFEKDKFHLQNGLSIVFRIIMSSLLIIALTAINNLAGYSWTYIAYSVIVIVCGVIAIFSYTRINKLYKLPTIKKLDNLWVL